MFSDKYVFLKAFFNSFGDIFDISLTRAIIGSAGFSFIARAAIFWFVSIGTTSRRMFIPLLFCANFVSVFDSNLSRISGLAITSRESAIFAFVCFCNSFNLAISERKEFISAIISRLETFVSFCTGFTERAATRTGFASKDSSGNTSSDRTTAISSIRGMRKGDSLRAHKSELGRIGFKTSFDATTVFVFATDLRAVRATTFFATGATATRFSTVISSPKAALADTVPFDTSTTGKYAPAVAFTHIRHNNNDTEKRCMFLSFLKSIIEQFTNRKQAKNKHLSIYS